MEIALLAQRKRLVLVGRPLSEDHAENSIVCVLNASTLATSCSIVASTVAYDDATKDLAKVAHKLVNAAVVVEARQKKSHAV
mmetsp:Transcript_122130/g.191604  ORF Transcript_122130/g.191604 Transcript_122130/m.191604 type:complete len:82 (+) Transcript_122130:49-294(+)